ncbi:MAG: PAS domain S-box protein [Burkholderiales bacterium]
MKVRPPDWRSLKTRVIVIALTVFFASVWAMALYAMHILHDDLQRLSGKQLASTANIVADQLNQEFVERIKALEIVAGSISATAIANPAAIQSLFEQRPLLQTLFSAGTYVTDSRGTAIASVPVGIDRIGVNFAERDHIVAALQQGRASVSEAVVGKVLQVPVVSLAAPIRGTDGTVIGAIVGVIDLSKSNFLDLSIGHRYGVAGGYLLVDPKHRIIVTATDKAFNLKPLLSVSGNALFDRFTQGFEGEDAFVDAQGVEHIAVADRLKVPGWYMVATLPTDEAFAPIRRMQNRLVALACVLTVMAGLLIRWMLARELDPVIATARTLARFSRDDEFPNALPVIRQDEVGDLIGGFNRLLGVLQQRESALVDSEQRARALVEWLPQAMVVHDGTTVLYANPAALQMLDAQSASDVVGKPLMDLVHPSFHALAASRAQRAVIAGNFSSLIQYTFVTVTGRLIDVEGQGIAIPYQGKAASQMVFYDITERNNTDKRLRQLSRATEQSPIAVVITDRNGNIEYVNPQFETVTGYALHEVLGSNPRFLQSGQTTAAVYADLWETLQAGETWRGEFHNRKKSGELFVEHAVIAPILDSTGAVTHFVALKEDITDAMRHQNELQSALQEKTALLNEVHHRVKNNLQVITSLLRLEVGRAKDTATRSVLDEMKGRIRSMALVHETLYRSGNFAGVELNRYLQQVASVAFRAQVSTGGNVRLALHLDPVTASMDQATPCGLLVNELISNCVKHGFGHGESGEVRVSLQRTDDHTDGLPRWCLRVSDTGVGLPADFEERRSHSLGLQLVGDLAGQIGGELVIEQGPGAAFSVTFPIGAT